MRDAGAGTLKRWNCLGNHVLSLQGENPAEAQYKAMLAAAPKKEKPE
jgi:hypothetical protein